MESAQTMTVERYLALAAESDEKLEYLGGAVVAMTGASPRHNAIVANLARALGNLLAESDGAVLASNQRVRVDDTSSYAYPDVTVACGSATFTQERPASLTNPTVIVEVLSSSTWMRDLSFKLAHYRRIPSVAHILLVGSEEPQVVHYRRADGAWVLTDHGRADVVELSALDVALALDEVFAKTDALPV